MSNRLRLFLQFGFALVSAVGLQTFAIVQLMRRAAANLSLDAQAQYTLLDLLRRTANAQIAYAVLNVLLVLFFAFWFLERTHLRPLRREEHQKSKQVAEKASALKEQQVQLANTEARLTRAEQLALLGRLSAGIAHEIGNPLGAVMGYIALLQDETDSDARKALLDRADRELSRINGLVHELLDYARPQPLRVAAHALKTVVAHAESLVKHQPRGHGLLVQTQIDAEALALCDADRLAQVVVNLMLNSADAMNGKGVLSVVATATEDEWIVSLRDHGPGFSVEALAHAGEPFFTTKGPGQGTGLGLAVCKSLVNEQGGTLSIANHQEGGGLVTLHLRRGR